jgi:predicted transposase YdaD
MEEIKESLSAYSVIYGKSINEIKEETIEEEREKTITNIRRKMGFSLEQIANMTDFRIEFVQSVIDKFEQKA